MKKQSCEKRKQTGSTARCTPKKRKQVKRQNCTKTSPGQKNVQNKSQLPVTCGYKEGVLYLKKYYNKQKCIFSEEQWFTPTEFEKFGMKEKNKKWRISILCSGIPLQRLIEDGFLPATTFKKSRVQDAKCSDSEAEEGNDEDDNDEHDNNEDDNNEHDNNEDDNDEHDNNEDDNDEHDNNEDDNNEHDNDEHDNNEDDNDEHDNNEDDDDDGDDDDDDDDDDEAIDMSVFEGAILPVSCGSDFGVLHKHRFSTGRCGRCVRTENSWLTPEDFIKSSKPEGTWKKDIVSHGVPLGKLITKRALEPHAVNCDCAICQEPDQNLLNDDVCFECNSDGDLVCCDACPRAFNSHCHIPAVDVDSSGSQWSCAFCMMKNVKSSTQRTQQDILSSPVSQYTLHCQYLLLHLLHESMTDPCVNGPGYSENICGPLMLGRVKLNLESNDYQTVQEYIKAIEYVFHHCTANRDNDFSRMTSRLKELFETVFKPL